jgi:GNAT superfamily N-acetyltransferase
MKKEYSIRKARIENIEPVKSILFSALNEYQIAIPDPYPVTDIDSIGSESAEFKTFTLVKNESVIGFIILRSISEDCMELKRLYLSSLERGRGLGRMLLEYAIQYAREKKVQTMRLETTSKFKEAVSLYRKSGFSLMEDVETSPGHDLALEKKL